MMDDTLQSATEKESRKEGVEPGFAELEGEFQIRIQGRFEASHFLYNYYPDGSHEPLHGHSWKVELLLARQGGGVGSDGISYDFLAARKRLDQLLVRLDHSLINELSEFNGVNPTSENLARWFFGGLRHTVEQGGGEVREIRIYEGPHNMASFSPAPS